MYCKYFEALEKFLSLLVLIVAKCIVNSKNFIIISDVSSVLIVAKCIVNKEKNILHFKIDGGINSSKVYCK